MLFFEEGKTPQNVGMIEGMKMKGQERFCEMCGKGIADPSHKAHVQGRGANFKNEQGHNPLFLGWDRLVLICEEDEA